MVKKLEVKIYNSKLNTLVVFVLRCSLECICYLDGQRIQVVEHHVVGLWKQCWITLERPNRRIHWITLRSAVMQTSGEACSNKRLLTEIPVSLLSSTCSRCGGKMGGCLILSSALVMYASCRYGPGGELDRSGEEGSH